MSEETFKQKIYSAIFKQEFPADLTLVVMWLAASIVARYLPILNQTPIPMIFALPVVLFIPGYCLIAALFPKNDDIGLIERIALSIGLSITIVSLVGFGLNFTPWGIRLEPILVSLTLFTWVLILVAHYRRAVLPFEDRFRISFFEVTGTFRKGIFQTGSCTVDRLLKTILAIVIIVALITTIYMIAFPKTGEQFTEFFILGENRTAADYPYRIITGQSYPIYIVIGNHEYQNMTYRIETWMLRTEFDNETNTSNILGMDQNNWFSLAVPYNETTIIPYNLSINKTGYNRVEFLLFNESVPGPEVTGSDRINASYRDLYLIVHAKETEYQEPSN